jgi:hypothetical protein
MNARNGLATNDRRPRSSDGSDPSNTAHRHKRRSPNLLCLEEDSTSSSSSSLSEPGDVHDDRSDNAGNNNLRDTSSEEEFLKLEFHPGIPSVTL